mgnify:CR=1 FL=1
MNTNKQYITTLQLVCSHTTPFPMSLNTTALHAHLHAVYGTVQVLPGVIQKGTIEKMMDSRWISLDGQCLWVNEILATCLIELGLQLVAAYPSDKITQSL